MAQTTASHMGEGGLQPCLQKSGSGIPLEVKFYDRPYSQCLGCFQAKTIKCRQCLNTMALRLKTSVQQHSSPNNRVKPNNAREPFDLKHEGAHAPREEVYRTKYVTQFRVKSKYEIYLEACMERKYLPRIKSETSPKNIHTKKIKYAINQSVGPKFQTWNKKSFDRIKSTLLMGFVETKQ